MTIEKILEQLAAILKQIQDYLATPEQTPQPDTKGNLQKFCLAIKDMEGWRVGSVTKPPPPTIPS